MFNSQELCRKQKTTENIAVCLAACLSDLSVLAICYVVAKQFWVFLKDCDVIAMEFWQFLV